MLQLKKISKKYKTGNLVQKALNNVSLNFRDNEFVSILGPSGSGKSTLLNIIGGLDRYDSGNLIINGVSTTKYKDQDWDSYRNHTVGFIFQSYNLITHQSLLANVELALTISGVSKSERRRRAKKALEKVGLKEHMHKRPNQISGGQMQRVAIARALVNNPDILLADEPTGALDTETSIQVMNLLKEVAKDRLVIMVTHNPKLAKQYSTRIVELKDGKVISDTKPYDVKKEEKLTHKNFGKASMKRSTAFSLSFNNLRTKKKRTWMVSFAGSIGIIGIALILALSNGVNKYIKDTEESTMSSYPLEITKSGFSLLNSTIVNNMTREEETGDIKELKTLANLLSIVNNNDLYSLRQYFENEDKSIYEYTKAIEYNYGIVPNIYKETNGKIRKVNPNESFSEMGWTSSNMFMQTSSFGGIDVFFQLPSVKELYESQYEVKYGRWPENPNECVIITNQNERLSDFIFYTLGLRDADQMDELIENFSKGNNTKIENDNRIWKYSDFDNITFKVIGAYDTYTYDENNNVFVNRAKDEEFLRELIKFKGRDLRVVGIISPNGEVENPILTSGIWYTSELATTLMKEASKSQIVKAQLSTPKTNVLTGKEFTDKEDNDFDFSKLLTIDTNSLKNAFKVDTSRIAFDTSSLSDMGDLSQYKDAYSNYSINLDALENIDIKVSPEKVSKLLEELTKSYLAYASKDPTTNYLQLNNSIQEYLSSDEGRQLLAKEVAKIIQNSGENIISTDYIKEMIASIMSGYQEFLTRNNYTDYSQTATYVEEYLNTNEAKALISKETQKLVASLITNVNLSSEQVQSLAESISKGYIAYAQKHNMPDPSKLKESFQEYLKTDGAKTIIKNGLYESLNVDEIKSAVNKAMTDSQAQAEGMMNEMMENIAREISSKIITAMQKSANSLPNAISIDTAAFSNAFKINMSEQELKSYIEALFTNAQSSYESNLELFGYAKPEELSSIVIYPKDFDSKIEIKNILTNYNDKMEKDNTPEKKITYTDVVGSMLSSITTIIDIISYVLIAFVAISLIVSSIMIGVITYISVLERRKEIGILRAIGASKKNISQVFNAETGIIGLMAGIIGVTISILITIPANIILHNVTKVMTLNAFLTIPQSITLIIISVVLTSIGGVIPSRSAANSDPVAALRTD